MVEGDRKDGQWLVLLIFFYIWKNFIVSIAVELTIKNLMTNML
ncbi:hypothetical protein BSG1_10088 [Bacillus sp. SG-1]|nr:hypothetical protein BSG1_10088 [Bacillus sp. SG-1]